MIFLRIAPIVPNEPMLKIVPGFGDQEIRELWREIARPVTFSMWVRGSKRKSRASSRRAPKAPPMCYAGSFRSRNHPQKACESSRSRRSASKG